MLADIFGNDTAENDEFLWKYFIETPAYKVAQIGKKRFIIGRKGSGKSAIFLQLQRNLIREHIGVITYSPHENDSFRLRNKLKILNSATINEIELESKFMFFWKEILKNEIAKYLSDNIKDKKDSRLQKIHKYINYYYKNDNCNNWNFNRIITSMLNLMDKLIINIGPVSLQTKKSNNNYNLLIEDIIFLIKKYYPNGIFILFDNLDEYWDKTSASLAFFRGLFSAIVDISEPKFKICPILFISSDVYSQIAPTYRNIDKLHQYEEEIKWNREDLFILVNKRIQVNSKVINTTNNNLNWYDIFPYRVGRSTSLNYILDRTLLRPRDILQFCKLSAELADNRNSKIISTHDIKKAEYKYSNWKAIDLQAEQYYIIPNLIDIMQQGFLGTKSLWNKDEILIILSKMVQLIKNNNNKNNNYDANLITITPEKLLQILYKIGFLKAIINKKRYQFHDHPQFPLNNADKFEIHPAFWRYLHLSFYRKKNI